MTEAPDFDPRENFRLSPLYVSDDLIITRYGHRYPLKFGYSGPQDGRYYIVGATEDGFATVGNLEAYLATE